MSVSIQAVDETPNIALFMMLGFVIAFSKSLADASCDTSTAAAVDVAAALTKAAAASRSAS